MQVNSLIFLVTSICISIWLWLRRTLVLQNFYSSLGFRFDGSLKFGKKCYCWSKNGLNIYKNRVNVGATTTSLALND